MLRVERDSGLGGEEQDDICSPKPQCKTTHDCLCGMGQEPPEAGQSRALCKSYSSGTLAGHAGLQAAGSPRTPASSHLRAGPWVIHSHQPGKLRTTGHPLLPQVRVYQVSTVRELPNPLDSAGLSADKLLSLTVSIHNLSVNQIR